MASGTLSIKLRCASWQQLATIYQRDLSKGTMFLRAATPPPVGTVLRIDLALPSATVIELRGVIDQHVSDQRGAGVEVRLEPIAAGSIWLIESALASEERKGTPAGGLPALGAAARGTGAPVASMADGADVAAAEADLVRALLAEAESLKKLNPFLVLGVGYEASDGDVRQAFGELTKRYHPDRFARYESSELRRVAAEIFILIRDAYRRLGDEAGRSQVLAQLGRSRHAIPIPRAAATGVRPGEPRKPPTAQIPLLPATPAPRQGSSARPLPIPRPVADARGAALRTAVVPPKAGAAPPTAVLAPPAQVSVPVPVPAPEGPDASALEELIDAGRLDEALAGYRLASKRHPQDRLLRAGIELCEGLLALAVRDRLEAAQRFETALEIDPSNERAARELAEMRRQATNERKGLLSRLMGKPEGRRDE